MYRSTSCSSSRPTTVYSQNEHRVSQNGMCAYRHIASMPPSTRPGPGRAPRHPGQRRDRDATSRRGRWGRRCSRRGGRAVPPRRPSPGRARARPPERGIARSVQAHRAPLHQSPTRAEPGAHPARQVACVAPAAAFAMRAARYPSRPVSHANTSGTTGGQSGQSASQRGERELSGALDRPCLDPVRACARRPVRSPPCARHTALGAPRLGLARRGSSPRRRPATFTGFARRRVRRRVRRSRAWRAARRTSRRGRPWPGRRRACRHPSRPATWAPRISPVEDGRYTSSIDTSAAPGRYASWLGHVDLHGVDVGADEGDRLVAREARIAGDGDVRRRGRRPRPDDGLEGDVGPPRRTPRRPGPTCRRRPPAGVHVGSARDGVRDGDAHAAGEHAPEGGLAVLVRRRRCRPRGGGLPAAPSRVVRGPDARRDDDEVGVDGSRPCSRRSPVTRARARLRAERTRAPARTRAPSGAQALGTASVRGQGAPSCGEDATAPPRRGVDVAAAARQPVGGLDAEVAAPEHGDAPSAPADRAACRSLARSASVPEAHDVRGARRARGTSGHDRLDARGEDQRRRTRGASSLPEASRRAPRGRSR